MNSQIKGLNVQIFQNGLMIEPSAQGYLGNFFAGDSIEMKLRMMQTPGQRRVLISTDRNRENPEYLMERASSEGNYFTHNVPIIQKGANLKFDREDADKNCVHLVEMSDAGIVQVTNIVISTQNGEAYLVFHPTYRVQAYQGDDGNYVAVPTLRIEPGFPSLIPIINQAYAEVKAKLPSIGAYQPEDDTKPEITETAKTLPDENHLVVKFWSVRTGTGGALRKLANGQIELVKLYWANLNVADRTPRHLLEGETIHAKGFRPVQQGRIRKEATGITRVEFEEAMKS